MSKFLAGLVGILVLVFAVVIIMVGMFAWQVIFPPITSMLDDATSTMKTAVQDDGNLSDAYQNSFVPLNNSFQTLEWISYIAFIFIIIGFIAVCFFVRTYPFLIVIWVIVMIILVFLSLILTVSYQDISSDPNLKGYYESWELSHYWMLYQPVILLVTLVVGGLILFFISVRGGEGALVEEVYI